MTDVSEEERQKLILDISRKMDAIREECLSGEPDWDPLQAAIPLKHCSGFMWMYREEWEDGTTIEVYRHGITRNWLHLDHDGRGYLYRDGDYIEIPVGVAVELVFADIGLLGATRETAYDDAYIREKHRKMREMGWTVIS
ncbi:MAG: hypothetical protein ABFR89_09500 [Actinomycetota bacterium]